MIRQQQSLPLSAYMDLYDLIVPKDNLLRKINEVVDFAVIDPSSYWHGNARRHGNIRS